MLDSVLQFLFDYEALISATVGLMSLGVAVWGVLRLAARPVSKISSIPVDKAKLRQKSAARGGWKSVFTLGVTEHSRLEELVAVRVVNVAFFSLIVLSFPWIVIDLLFARAVTFITLVVVVVFSAAMLGLALQRAGATTAARWLVIVLAAFYWLSVLLVIGPQQGTEYFVAALMGMPVLILSRAHRLQRLLSILVVVGVFILGVSLARGDSASSPLSDELLTYRYYANAFFLAAIIVATVSYYKRFAATSYELVAFRKKKNDALVSRLIPADLAQQMANKETVAAKWHPEGTVLVATLTGFSDLYTRLPAIDIVNKLDELYSRLDEIVEKNQVEKVKTLGTTYVAAAGLTRSGGADARVAASALAMRHAVDDFARQERLSIGFQCALATGLTISGVIGKARPRFDIWGAALDEASVLNAAAREGDILVNETTYWRLHEHFQFAKTDGSDAPFQLISDSTERRAASS